MNRVLWVPHSNFSVVYPQTLFQLLRPLYYAEAQTTIFRRGPRPLGFGSRPGPGRVAMPGATPQHSGTPPEPCCSLKGL